MSKRIAVASLVLASLAVGSWMMAQQAAPNKPDGAGRGYRIPNQVIGPRVVLVANLYKEDKLLILEEWLTDLTVPSEPKRFEEYSRFSLKQGTAFLADGRQLSEQELWERLTARPSARPTVLLAPDRRALASHYRSVLKDDAIILIGETEFNGVYYPPAREQQRGE